MSTLEERLAYEIHKHQNPRPKRAPLPVEPPATGLRVVLSVRHPDGGHPFRFEYLAKTVSHLDAEIRAKEAARREGLRPWCVIEIIEGVGK